MRRQHWVTWLASALMCVMLAAVAAAQSGNSTLQGKVVDAQKASLPGASVTIANPSTGLTRETTSDASGAFAFPGMPPGTYALTVSMQGFKTAVVEKVALQVDSTNDVTVGLEIGSLNESVQVRRRSPVINTTDASIGQRHQRQPDPRPAARGPQRRRLLRCSPASTYMPKSRSRARRSIRATAP